MTDGFLVEWVLKKLLGTICDIPKGIKSNVMSSRISTVQPKDGLF